MEIIKEYYKLTTNKERIDISYVHRSLGNTYWAKNIPLQTVQSAINNSICFSVFHKGEQVGFARVITDSATFAYLCDVFIDEQHQGKGLGKWLVETIVQYAPLQGLRRFMLATKDAHGLYKHFGFEQLTNTENWMQVHNPDIYNY